MTPHIPLSELIEKFWILFAANKQSKQAQAELQALTQEIKSRKLKKL